jgi:hypothetical protein
MVKKNYTEAEMVRAFGLIRIERTTTPLMQRWLDVSAPVLDIVEQTIFDRIFYDCIDNIRGWNEEELKMEFISPLMFICNVKSTDKYRVFYERIISETVENKPLTVKTDYMIATGVLNLHENPYFYFQEYKPDTNPTGDAVGQLLQAMLIAQVKNKNNKPIYGAKIDGKYWSFMTLEQKTYCISKGYDCTDRDELLAIISILRKFKHILETELIVD